MVIKLKAVDRSKPWSPFLRFDYLTEERIPSGWRCEVDIGKEGMSAWKQPVTAHESAVAKGLPILW